MSGGRKPVDQIESETRERERNRLAWNLPRGVTRPPARRVVQEPKAEGRLAGPETGASDG